MDAGGAALIEAADPFAPVNEVAALFHGFDRPWFIAGGWAIDLFLNRGTRDHGDVDVAIFRRDQRAFRAYLSDWEFQKVVEGRREPWPAAEWLKLPVHEVHGHPSAGEPKDLEVLLNEAGDDHWIFRRDARITRPVSKVIVRTRAGIPFLGPEVVLLFKAKDSNAKDMADFEPVRPRLGFGRRLWLRGALHTCYPGHPWIARL